MIKIGDQIQIRGDNGQFSADIYIVTGLRRGIVETAVGAFNKSDVRKARKV